MGYRMDTFVGLNGWATKFVAGNMVLSHVEIIHKVYPSGVEEISEPRDVFVSDVKVGKTGKVFEGLNHGYPMRKFTFPNNDEYVEDVQAAPMSSGHVIFTALRDRLGRWVEQSLWKPIQIREYV